jgi:leucyl-tRNA synthetase
MSKSAGNVVSPIDIIKKHGVDVSRIAMYFAAPSEREILWNDEGIVGSSRFLNRIYRFAEKASSKNINDKIRLEDLTGSELRAYRKLNQTIKKVEEDIGTLQLNTAIAGMMELLNVMDELNPTESKVFSLCVEKLAQILAPFAPHLSEEIWSKLGHKQSIFKSKWPVFDKDAIKEEEATIVVQVNGKLRATINFPLNTSEEEVKRLVLANERVKNFTDNKKIVKTIFVPNKLINVVVENPA